MLVYEKVAEELRKLYGTEANIPADADKEIVFRFEDGTIATVNRNSKLFDDGNGGMLLEVNGERKFVGMLIGTDATICIVPKGKEIIHNVAKAAAKKIEVEEAVEAEEEPAIEEEAE